MDYLFNNNNTGLKIITDFISLKTNYLCKTEPSTHPKVQLSSGLYDRNSRELSF